MADPESAVETYISLWKHPMPEAELRSAIDRCWAEDAIYTDPRIGPIVGRDGLAGLVMGFFQRNPDGTVATGRFEHHHGRGRFAWALRRGDGTTLSEGVDFVDFAADGRIQRITGFFGPAPQLV